MKKFITFLSSLIFSVSAFAYSSYNFISDNSRIESLLTDDSLDEVEEIQKSIKEYGYHNTYSNNARSLMDLADEKGEKIVEDDPYFKILRLDTSDFNLTFPYKGFGFTDKFKFMGIVPSGTQTNDGWTGFTAYFKHSELGLCKFMVFDSPAMKGHTYYDLKHTNFDVNEKPSINYVEGNEKSGFLYTISWTGKRYDNTLNCANEKPFERSTMKNLILLAKKLDMDLPDPVK